MYFHSDLLEKPNSQWEKAIISNKTKLYKEFSGIPNHEYLRIEANFHFLSGFWHGEAVYLTLDDEILWLDHHDWEDSIENLINSLKLHEFIADSEDQAEKTWISPINVIIKSDKNEFSINFVSQGNEKNLFWIDNFNIYIK